MQIEITEELIKSSSLVWSDSHTLLEHLKTQRDNMIVKEDSQD
jgi:hypothetical protein